MPIMILAGMSFPILCIPYCTKKGEGTETAAEKACVIPQKAVLKASGLLAMPFLTVR